MNSGTLTIYSASAGSGKTFQLTRIFLTHIFRSRYNYRKILAVTFTNKATAEMKNRILDQLYRLANGEESEYLTDLTRDTGKSVNQIRSEAAVLLSAILQDFSRFSISTIDTFFQKVIRSFARESGLQSGYNVELDHSIILSAAIDKMIASSAADRELKEWLTEYVLKNLEEEKSWNLKGEITRLAEELFREKFKTLPENERKKLENKDYLRGYIQKIRDIITSIDKDVRDFGSQLQDFRMRFSLTDDMFYQKSRGVPGFIKSMSEGQIKLPNSYVRQILDDKPKWSSKDPSPQLLNAIDAGLHKTLTEAIAYCINNYPRYQTAKAVSAKIYTLGILSDVLVQVRKAASDENSFLISDAGELLSLITEGDQASFIYEKIGNAFENFMIDEFQDTSYLQWKNFQPLIAESMGRGCDNLIVGDIKQSIYRWRNSDWQILADLQGKKPDNERILKRSLENNWRSRSGIIKFNNTLFSLVPLQTDRFFSEEDLESDLKSLYEGAVQSDPGIRGGGYVRLEFSDIKDSAGDNTDNGDRQKSLKTWKSVITEKIPQVIELFQDHGYQARDIGIIVREGREGEEIVRKIIEYSSNCPPEKKQKYNYNIVSDDSLALSSSYAITFIMAVLKVLHDPGDMISRAEMFRFFMLLHRKDKAEEISLYKELLTDETTGLLPEGYDRFLARIRNRPLFEVTENIISFFGLGDYPENVPYLQTFQDLVLNFSRSRTSDTDAFLEWWKTGRGKRSISLPSGQNSMRVLTIHKSKGLEFPVVILPFLTWNIDHMAGKQPVLWVRPEVPPFNEVEMIPVNYSSALSDTFFAEDYFREKYYSCIDNINLLYVAMTRARDAIYGFAPRMTTGKISSVSSILGKALESGDNPAGKKGIVPGKYFNKEDGVFEYGTIPGTDDMVEMNETVTTENYRVNNKPESLRLRLHGVNYLTPSGKDKMRKIDYGNLIHEAFEGIGTPADIPVVLDKLMREGKITDSESLILEEKLSELINSPQVSDWFLPGLKVLKESEILSPSGDTRRPDRVIIEADKAVVIDYKSGGEHGRHAMQMREYRKLLSEMGYSSIESFLWYIDKNRIVRVS